MPVARVESRRLEPPAMLLLALGLPRPQTEWGVSVELGVEKRNLQRIWVREMLVSLLVAILAKGMQNLADRRHVTG